MNTPWIDAQLSLHPVCTGLYSVLKRYHQLEKPTPETDRMKQNTKMLLAEFLGQINGEKMAALDALHFCALLDLALHFKNEPVLNGVIYNGKDQTYTLTFDDFTKLDLKAAKVDELAQTMRISYRSRKK